MALGITRSLTVLALAAMPLAGLTAAFTVLGAEAVQAGNGNGGGNGNGNGGGNHGGNRSSSEERGNGSGHGGPGD